MSRQGRGEGRFGFLGVAAAACVACCAGPILAFFAGVTIAGAAATVVVGVAGVALAVATAVTFVVVRHRSASCVSDADAPVPVAAPVQKTAPLNWTPGRTGAPTRSVHIGAHRKR